jgi:hypothetical protein
MSSALRAHLAVILQQDAAADPFARLPGATLVDPRLCHTPSTLGVGAVCQLTDRGISGPRANGWTCWRWFLCLATEARREPAPASLKRPTCEQGAADAADESDGAAAHGHGRPGQ